MLTERVYLSNFRLKEGKWDCNYFSSIISSRRAGKTWVGRMNESHSSLAHNQFWCTPEQGTYHTITGTNKDIDVLKVGFSSKKRKSTITSWTHFLNFILHLLQDWLQCTLPTRHAKDTDMPQPDKKKEKKKETSSLSAFAATSPRPLRSSVSNVPHKARDISSIRRNYSLNGPRD